MAMRSGWRRLTPLQVTAAIAVIASIMILSMVGPAARAADIAALGVEDGPLGIALEGWPYPYPVHVLERVVGGQPCRMAFMDVAPTGRPNGHVAVLMHGKNFSSDYWAGVIADLTAVGTRVVVPDQIGFNKSSKPDTDYSFDGMAADTTALLDSIGVSGPVDLIGHSTGGMLAVRFAALHPDRVRKLLLEDPIGLEDYRDSIPPQTTETLTDAERRQTAASYAAFVARYFVSYPKDKQQVFVTQRMRIARSGEFERWAKSAAETYQMIYRQPMRSEYKLLAMPVMIVVGAQDRTVVMKGYGDPDRTTGMGNFPVLARSACADVRDCRVTVIDGSGHVPHLERPEAFLPVMRAFLQ